VPESAWSSHGATNGAGNEHGVRKPGWGRGIITFIAPDFDEPLEDFNGYTQ
jgi:hypothetical protein